MNLVRIFKVNVSLEALSTTIAFGVDQMIAGDSSREESPGSAGQDGRNADRSQDQGKCHRKQTAERVFGLRGKGEKVR